MLLQIPPNDPGLVHTAPPPSSACPTHWQFRYALGNKSSCIHMWLCAPCFMDIFTSSSYRPTTCIHVNKESMWNIKKQNSLHHVGAPDFVKTSLICWYFPEWKSGMQNVKMFPRSCHKSSEQSGPVDRQASWSDSCTSICWDLLFPNYPMQLNI